MLLTGKHCKHKYVLKDEDALVPDLSVGRELDPDLAVVISGRQLRRHGQLEGAAAALHPQNHLPSRIVPAGQYHGHH